MKLSVSLPEADVAFLDDYATRAGGSSRSSVVQRAIRLLRTAELEEAYAHAYQEWEASEDAELWDRAAGDGDGYGDASR
ncbi:hypothetical protein JQS43_19785 [Natronosporangium hydrolyticum]|uniref:Ribbon-helix-helix protein, CopG family n=1 Tax=Natronosporangium hydrolyticum TaxID=2811111 RepID=A0A895YJ24_9ACTN|nr:ribbon-helix-helix domain-containing protein [Natronosporangium hydrolyticum]QSB13778.1 hypothetical protein JQS43_19785 [Natronosporangium hydrolyticum]